MPLQSASNWLAEAKKGTCLTFSNNNCFQQRSVLAYNCFQNTNAGGWVRNHSAHAYMTKVAFSPGTAIRLTFTKHQRIRCGPGGFSLDQQPETETTHDM